MKRLLIDVDKLLSKSASSVQCEYLYHSSNNGLLSLVEIAEFALYCRQCPDSHCVKACPRDALERQPDGTVKRYNLRCVGCKSCVLACPFGTLFPETINFVSDHCDYCIAQRTTDPEYVPLCVKTSKGGEVLLIELDEENPAGGLFFVGKHLAVKTHHWRYKEGKVL
ncbi:4Fe-4S dicluster domain-containing protein [Kosmotoga pacifica]|uniref:4Fe-4S ferredoxin n=1 Tax=Kosmotoga pacifica TaxID=1330330 RepID=A0A0G2ZBW3_9BACT|nr:4Fe-4S dicluster domain-containing protein [Kosmotoga pacifica]AKI97566.1 4Fe-4S ferredoxin [Kosmotoga pacifica]